MYQLTPSLVKGVFVFRCNLPPALLSKWLGSFTFHCSNRGLEQTQNKSQHREVNSPAAPGRIDTQSLSRRGMCTRQMYGKLWWRDVVWICTADTKIIVHIYEGSFAHLLTREGLMSIGFVIQILPAQKKQGSLVISMFNIDAHTGSMRKRIRTRKTSRVNEWRYALCLLVFLSSNSEVFSVLGETVTCPAVSPHL